MRIVEKYLSILTLNDKNMHTKYDGILFHSKMADDESYYCEKLHETTDSIKVLRDYTLSNSMHKKIL